MTSLQRKQHGFTIVELLIVIVVIGILAALVVTTFNGIQQKARNTERQTDVNAIHSQVEAYYAQNGKYPSLDQINETGAANAGWRAANMKGLDAQALKDPKGTATTLAGAAAADVYSYVVTPTGCDNGTGGDCTGYTMTATYEGTGTYVKTSLN